MSTINFNDNQKNNNSDLTTYFESSGRIFFSPDGMFFRFCHKYTTIFISFNRIYLGCRLSFKSIWKYTSWHLLHYRKIHYPYNLFIINYLKVYKSIFLAIFKMNNVTDWILLLLCIPYLLPMFSNPDRSSFSNVHR